MNTYDDLRPDDGECRMNPYSDLDLIVYEVIAGPVWREAITSWLIGPGMWKTYRRWACTYSDRRSP